MSGYKLIRSLIGEIANGLDRLIDSGDLNGGSRIALYGLDRYSFAMRTILEHRGLGVSCYVSEDEAEVIKKKREIKDFACKFLSGERDIINIVSLPEYLEMHEESRLLIADADYQGIAARLDSMGLKENKDFFKICDFKDPEIDEIVSGRHQLSVDEMRAKEKAMLSFIDDYCRQNGLRYWVCGGTLLGAVRHEGFIPWDDDIDVFLPMPDYLKFTESLRDDPDYELMGYGTEGGEDFIEPFAKLLEKDTVLDESIGTLRKLSAVWVDVFPLVGLPDDDKERHRFFSEYREIEKSAWQDFYKTDGDIGVFKKWFVKQKEYLHRYDFDNAGYVGVLGTKYDEKDCTTRPVYDDTIRMKFEDIEVNAPAGYKEYLSNLYGSNYIDLPPVEKRVTIHDIKAYE